MIEEEKNALKIERNVARAGVRNDRGDGRFVFVKSSERLCVNVVRLVCRYSMILS